MAGDLQYPRSSLPPVPTSATGQLRGHLKIFVGYAGGVGTTYTILDAARRRKLEGQDVVIGSVQTHGLDQTEALIQGLEIIPGGLGSELDLDAILARRPSLVIIDDLAHENLPGSRHPQRYQDVEELLAAGIDVYASCNIYNLESLRDVVYQITGLEVKVTFPDRMVLSADEIELVDLPVDELQRRIQEIDNQSARVEGFPRGDLYRRGNLVALRELAMRWAAERVDQQLRSYMKSKEIPGPWPAKEHILVCIGTNPNAEKLIRAGARLAADLKAGWTVVHIQARGSRQYRVNERAQLNQNFNLAEQLGAQCLTLPALSIMEGILDIAHQSNTTKILVGKTHQPRWLNLLNVPLAEKLMRSSGKIDLMVIGSEPDEKKFWPKATRELVPHRPWLRYLISLLLVALITAIGSPLVHHIDPTNLAMLYLIIVIISAFYLGRGPTILASLLSALAFDFFLVEPRFTMTVADTQYLITLFGLLAVGLVMSQSLAVVKDQLVMLRLRDVQTRAINALSRDLTAAQDIEEMLSAVIKHLSTTLSRAAVILLAEGGQLIRRAATPGFELSAAEISLANWCFANSREAGRGSDTQPDSRIRFIPLQSASGLLGVLGVTPVEQGKFMTGEQRQLLEGFASLAALGIERARFVEQAGHAEMLQATEKLQTALLNSVSHDLRTPLAAIAGVLSTMKESETDRESQRLDRDTRLELLDTAWDEVERLNRFVGNLLDMTRLESGGLHLRRELVEVQDLIGTVVRQMRDRLKAHQLRLDLGNDLAPVRIDFLLFSQVLINLLDNAVKFSPLDSVIEVTARGSKTEVEIAVLDRGVGIPPEDLENVFGKFYRVQRPSGVSGTGLGLSISKGIVEAHGGHICAENREGGGTAVRITLPVEERESL